LFLTGVFLVTGMAFFLLAEYNNTASGAMGTLPAGQRFLAAFFQSATPRTAGFNTIDQASLTGSSKIVTILLMFVGAAPGSTGGGIKVTTFAMLIAAVFAELRGYEYPVLLRHRIARAVFNKAFLILSLGFFTVLVTTVGMTFTERALLASGGTTVLDLLFEAVSAFGTVGLSAAGTPNLSQGSWLLLTVSMIVGRVGPASFAISLLQGPRSDTRDMVFPEGRCIVG
jgi:trk system potassium uptake protein TrkH